MTKELSILREWSNFLGMTIADFETYTETPLDSYTIGYWPTYTIYTGTGVDIYLHRNSYAMAKRRGKGQAGVAGRPAFLGS